ncbi:fimbrial protein (plasmid) [Klebsiella aerogenes]
MKQFTMSLLMLAVLIRGVGTYAEDKTPNLIITGTVTTDSCTVSTDSQSLQVPLGDVVTGMFVRPGDTSPAQKFVIKLSDCDEGITGATITFSGTPDSDNSDLLKITKDTDSATGIGVGVIDDISDKLIPLGKATATKALTSGDNNLIYWLRYQSTLETVTAGSANAVMYFDINYK